jgi:hypothetical protein
MVFALNAGFACHEKSWPDCDKEAPLLVAERYLMLMVGIQ